ncbi:hypothetical protein R3P38DRAFT_3304750 [Favolaschia claudopus]|uniref:Uncharacterized protein n=1 Tax=Favolaschia claudopus TaxID=2862362 RepID=A0AAW0DW07_9AGAR
MPPARHSLPKSSRSKGKQSTASKSKKASTSAKATQPKQTGKRGRSPSDSESSGAEDDNKGDTQGTTSKRPQKRAKKTAEVVAAPSPSGKFDLYRMELPFLSKVYRPPGQTDAEPHFGPLYDALLELQAKPDSSGRCLLPDAGSQGRLRCIDLEDPMEGMPWDIALTALEVVDKVVFSAAERKKFLPAPQKDCGKGIHGRTELAVDHCGVQKAEGVFRMQRAWIGERDGKKVELWEGYLSFNVSHAGMYRRMGAGAGRKDGFPFWAVRARKDADGNEIGLNEA